GVSAGRAGELKGVLPTSRLEKDPVHCFQEVFFSAGGHVEAMNDAVALNVLNDFLFEYRIIVAIVERSGATEKVDVLLTVFVNQYGAAGLVKNYGERPDVAANLRLHPVKNI